MRKYKVIQDAYGIGDRLLEGVLYHGVIEDVNDEWERDRTEGVTIGEVCPLPKFEPYTHLLNEPYWNEEMRKYMLSTYISEFDASFVEIELVE